jgi:hypothetical protein
MKGYNARLAQTSSIKFSERPIVLRAEMSVHLNTKLSWIEELDEEASESEQQWYENVINNNLEVSNG